MTRITFLLGLCSLALSMYGSVGPVAKLSAAQFRTAVKEIVLVKFYSPSCGHCHNFKTEYEKAARSLKHIVKVAAVDATTENTGAQISGYPTVKLYIQGKDIDYSGPREAAEVVDFVMHELNRLIGKRSGKSSGSKAGSSGSSSGGSGKSDVVQLTDSNFDKLVLKSDDAWFVQFYAPWCGHCKNLAPEWEKLATSLKGEVKVAKVDATVQKSLASEYGVQGFPTLIWFPSGKKSGNHEKYEGGRDHESMKQFAIKQVGEIRIKHLFSQDTYDNACKDSHLCVLAFVPNEEVAQQERYVEVLQSAANQYSNVKFTWSLAGEQPDLAQFFGISDYPVLLILAGMKSKYARMLKGFSKENVRETLADVFGGKMKQWRPLGKVPGVRPVQESKLGQKKRRGQQL